MRDEEGRGRGAGAVSRRAFQHALKRRDLGIAPVVAHLFDHPLGGGEGLPGLRVFPHGERESCVLKVGIRLKKPHARTLRDGHGLVKVATRRPERLTHPMECRAGDAAAGDESLLSCLPQAVNGTVEILCRL